MILETYWLDIFFAIIGGILLALATSANIIILGKITGMSGCYFNFIRFKMDSPFFCSVSLFCGMIATSNILYFCIQFKKINQTTPFFDNPQQMISNLDLIGFALSGLLVGFGTKLGNGCTSGHGLCGLPRFSLRSFVAVGLFMIFGISFATFRKYISFLDNTQYYSIVSETNFNITQGIMLALTLFAFLLINFFSKNLSGNQFLKNIVYFFVGILFAMGLIIGGMSRRSKINGFLAIGKKWDPSLIFLMMTAVIINFITFNYAIKKQKVPLACSAYELPQKSKVDKQLIIGEIIFGIGWGLGSLQKYQCPGPAIVLFSFCSPHITAIYFPFLALGQYLAYFYQTKYILPNNEKINIQQPLNVKINHL